MIELGSTIDTFATALEDMDPKTVASFRCAKSNRSIDGIFFCKKTDA